MKLLGVIGAVCLPAFAGASANDIVRMKNHAVRSGTLVGLDAGFYRMRLTFPAPSPDAPPAEVTVAIPRGDVAEIAFASDTARSRLLALASPAHFSELEVLWKQWRPWLPVPRSPAAEVGLAYGEMLLKSNGETAIQSAFALFQQIEAESWDAHAREQARHGRLRAMIAAGQAGPAAREAAEMAQTAEDPALLIAAKYVLAEASARALEKLENEHPRWNEDPFVRPERQRLFHETIDLFLFPYLFFGSEIEPAARGLWRATEVYQTAGETQHARDLADDLAALYPETPQANRARDFLTRFPGPPPDNDHEK